MTRRGWVGVAVLALWAVALGWHVQREYFEPELTRLARATLDLEPGTHFYLLSMGERTVGTASSRLDTIPGGFSVEDQMILGLVTLGQAGDAITNTRVELDRALQMRSFRFRLTSDDGDFGAEGEVSGDSLLVVRVQAAGAEPEEVTFRVDEAPLFAAALPIRLAKGGELQVGRSLRIPVFDPSTVSTRTVEIQVLEEDVLVLPDSAGVDPETGRWSPVGEREVRAWRISEDFGGIRTESWVDEDGRVVRASSPMGFSMERMPFELARQARDDEVGRRTTDPAGGDILFSTAIEARTSGGEAVPSGRELAGRDHLRYVLSGLPPEGDFDLEGGRQELRGDTLDVRREELASLDPGYSLPYPRMDLAEALRPEPLIQSGHESIREVSARVVGPAGGDPVEAARRINDFVFDLLDKEITLAVPSALQVLETRRGDCMEHTTLYLALARAAGLPARAAVGLVHLDGRFFYHAWPEVWLGEWVAMEPTFGEAPAGATHLRFLTGSLARQVEVAQLIGTLDLELILP
ncbi:MAG: transglutaminase domain-containing protein [Gemmatimonadales bacterium]|nr:MAG: transglutaminase domain-containing protein [Gemmatimonadales bacterium]